MAQTKEFVIEIERELLSMYAKIGIDKPENHDAILYNVVNDVLETADPLNWHSGDVVIAFRRWIENQSSEVINTPKEDYFKIVRQGYNHELQREEIQIHAGKNGNVFLIKTEQGFIIDVYAQQDHLTTQTIWEDYLK